MKKIDDQTINITVRKDLSFEIGHLEGQVEARDGVVMCRLYNYVGDIPTPTSSFGTQLYPILSAASERYVAPPFDRFHSDEWDKVREGFVATVHEVIRLACKGNKEVSDIFIVPGWEEDGRSVCEILNEDNTI